MREVRIPKMGMSTQEVDVVGVHVQPGQHLDVGNAITDIESEKVTFTVEAEVAGTVVEVFVQKGTQRNVGDLLCTVQEDVAT